MKILVLNAHEVAELLTMKECIAVMREALIALAAGKVHQPLRTIIRPSDARGVMGLMPAYMSEVGRRSEVKGQRSEVGGQGKAEGAPGETATPPAHAGGSDKATPLAHAGGSDKATPPAHAGGSDKTATPPAHAGGSDKATPPAHAGGSDKAERSAFGLKAICVFPGNPAKGLDSHQGAVLLFSAETGELLAMMNASAITAIRTAAVSGVATDLLARADACNLAIIGSGVQARSHLTAMSKVRSIKRCRIASRRLEHAQRFAEDMRREFSFALEPVETVEQALEGADLIVTATTSVEPVVKREWIAAGAHLNLVGSSTPKSREVDSATMAAASLFVDRRESTVNEAGDYLFAVRDGAIGPEHIRAEIGEVLIGDKPGRTSAKDITLFKSLGLATEDLFAAEYLYRRAAQEQVGTWVEF